MRRRLHHCQNPHIGPILLQACLNKSAKVIIGVTDYHIYASVYTAFALSPNIQYHLPSYGIQRS